jgi:hypothetical protein
MLFLVDQKSKREEGKKVDDLFAAGTMSRVWTIWTDDDKKQ